jgi:NAD+ kinase
MMMGTIGLLRHPQLTQSEDLAREIELALAELGVNTWTVSAWDDQRICKSAPGSDCLITLGGDGTIIRAARLVAGMGVPILGVNMGRVGFLAETEPTGVIALLPGIVGGQYRVEERTMLRATVNGEDQDGTSYEAVNDAVVCRGRVGRVVHVSAYVDGEFLTTYVCDCLIAATATGSTAYALAAGGPVLDPELDDILLIPVAPHLSMSRAVVLPGSTELALEVVGGREASLTVDGQVGRALVNGDRVLVSKSPHRARFIRLSPASLFYRTLLRRLRRPDQAPQR